MISDTRTTIQLLQAYGFLITENPSYPMQGPRFGGQIKYGTGESVPSGGKTTEDSELKKTFSSRVLNMVRERAELIIIVPF